MKPNLPENYGEETWDKLRQAIHAVHNQRPICYSLEELYQAVENMCSHKMAAKLYDNLRKECEKHVQTLVPLFQQADLEDVQFLVVVDRQWTDHCRQMVCVLEVKLVCDEC